ncbi:hypothetical protein [Endozoicomonas sp. OPT23]|uniref:hypothetical protein n=1 Tax=Endozoicomonas sp. OPT23 TaxID=2072845 RepID=UPI00129BC3A6|nr:hypothetical protein [Endozoicomonas sp. OPT23]
MVIKKTIADFSFGIIKSLQTITRGSVRRPDENSTQPEKFETCDQWMDDIYFGEEGDLRPNMVKRAGRMLCEGWYRAEFPVKVQKYKEKAAKLGPYKEFIPVSPLSCFPYLNNPAEAELFDVFRAAEEAEERLKTPFDLGEIVENCDLDGMSADELQEYSMLPSEPEESGVDMGELRPVSPQTHFPYLHNPSEV